MTTRVAKQCDNNLNHSNSKINYFDWTVLIITDVLYVLKL